jgi:hypothetical protein
MTGVRLGFSFYIRMVSDIIVFPIFRYFQLMITTAEASSVPDRAKKEVL